MTEANFLSGNYPTFAKVQTLTELMVAFNQLYRLPVMEQPSIPFEFLPNGQAISDRIENFQMTLLDEIDEGDEICKQVRAESQTTLQREESQLDVLVLLADWLGDICVYCMSEAAKFGIPLEDVIRIIMASNMSKLGEDGKPIYDSRGKVLKGPSYWKPEPRIRELLMIRTQQFQRELHANQLEIPQQIVNLQDGTYDARN